MSPAELADRAAITDLIHRYARAVDRLDVPLGQSVWHADGTADYGDYYRGSGAGVIERICRDHAGLQCHQHQIGNVLIRLDGDRAGSEAYVTATLRMAAGDGVRQMQVWSRYADTWSRRDGRWGIDHRVAIREFDEVRLVTPMQPAATGTRDRGDPSYGVLEP